MGNKELQSKVLFAITPILIIFDNVKIFGNGFIR